MVRKRGFCYDKDQHSKDCLIEKIEVRRKRLKINQGSLGRVLGISQQAYAYRIDPKRGNASFDYIELVKLFSKLNFSDDEILKIMKPE